MSRPNFTVKVPSIPFRPKSRIKKLRRKSMSCNLGSSIELETIDEANVGETRDSSYYSLASPVTSEPKLKILETYDEFLNLKDLEKIYWNSTDSVLGSMQQSQESVFLLKQICAELQLDTVSSEKGSQSFPTFQTEYLKNSSKDIHTAIIAQRIMDTEKQIANSRKNGGTGFSRDSLRKSPFNKSVKSLGRIDELPCTSSILSESLSKTLSNLTSRYIIKQKKTTCDFQMQVNIEVQQQPLIQHSCNTQTEASVSEYSLHLLDLKKFVNQKVQVNSKAKSQYVQPIAVLYEDKYVSTTTSSFYHNQEQSTQMYEHITENDLLCIEWIDKNLFRVPVNPNTVIIDERLKDSSELTCLGTSFFEQELIWERQALCL